MKKNLFILALIAIFVSVNVMAQTAVKSTTASKTEVKAADKACCKDAKTCDAKEVKSGACCKDKASADKKSCCQGKEMAGGKACCKDKAANASCKDGAKSADKACCGDKAAAKKM